MINTNRGLITQWINYNKLCLFCNILPCTSYSKLYRIWSYQKQICAIQVMERLLWWVWSLTTSGIKKRKSLYQLWENPSISLSKQRKLIPCCCIQYIYFFAYLRAKLVDSESFVLLIVLNLLELSLEHAHVLPFIMLSSVSDKTFLTWYLTGL